MNKAVDKLLMVLDFVGFGDYFGLEGEVLGEDIISEVKILSELSSDKKIAAI